VSYLLLNDLDSNTTF